MKRVALLRKTPLRANKRGLHWITPRRIVQLNNEVEARKALCYRAGGLPISKIQPILIKGKTYELTTVTCQGGHCQICGKARQLEPHEWPPRSRGTKVSLEFSKMVCRECHEKEQHSSPMWTTRNGGNE